MSSMKTRKSDASFLIRAAQFGALIAIFSSAIMATAQSAKTGRPQQTGSVSPSKKSPSVRYNISPSPGDQLRQQQREEQAPIYQTPRAPAVSNAGSGVKRPSQQEIQQQQQQQYDSQSDQSTQTSTEDPLADSEPAIYGSVAGQPGVDFPAYTTIPKTSFTCEGKGYDFGFYADEEAQCQVYHVCWSGRRESFLCGVGTVFNQAILACDYWHSVDCSKSSQFYGVNSELGKASAEPSPKPSRQPLSPATIGNQRSNGQQGGNFGDTQRRVAPQPSRSSNSQYQPQVQQQQQQEDSDFAQTPQPQSTAGYGNDNQPNQQQQVQQFNDRDTQQATRTEPVNQPSGNFVPQRKEQTNPNGYQQQQQAVKIPLRSSTNNNQQGFTTPTYNPSSSTSSSLASPNGATKRRFNMDLNQKVNSLIESPVRAPISKAAQPKPKQARGKSSAPRSPSRNQQNSSPATNGRSYSTKQRQQQVQQQPPSPPAQQPPPPPPPPQAPVQQQQQLDRDIEEPQQQQQQIPAVNDVQQQSFDDSPTSTTQGGLYDSTRQSVTAAPSRFASQQMIIHSGGSGDGSSAITSQYDTFNGQQQLQNFNQPQLQQQAQQQQSYDSSSVDDSIRAISPDDDFRSSGARAAASNNQNWYIMRSI